MSVSTFIINLEKRTERKNHALKQFELQPEFNTQLVKAIESENGALGLWLTIKHIVRDLASKDEPYILICEDDHQFTKHYNKEALFDSIQTAGDKKADVLIGGVSWLDDSVQISEDLFWIKQFTGTQFVVVFRKFFKSILEADFSSGDTADRKIASLSANKFIMFPFISVQKEFGYSDATTRNNVDGRVDQLFQAASEKLENLVKVSSFYQLKT